MAWEAEPARYLLGKGKVLCGKEREENKQSAGISMHPLNQFYRLLDQF
ncbi:unnamed protein product [marine sediment metagenome]|uniref:Uncharacterized protein n=1 Tax=marine sediment metagenome TaxID=412755 RepID=X1NIK1_9ZZZZ